MYFKKGKYVDMYPKVIFFLENITSKNDLFHYFMYLSNSVFESLHHFLLLYFYMIWADWSCNWFLIPFSKAFRGYSKSTECKEVIKFLFLWDILLCERYIFHTMKDTLKFCLRNYFYFCNDCRHNPKLQCVEKVDI